MSTSKIIKAVVDIDSIINGGYSSETINHISEEINSYSGRITKVVAAPTLFSSPRDDISRPSAVALIIYYEANAEDYKQFSLDLSVVSAVDFSSINLSNTDPNGTVLLPYATEELIIISARY